MFEAHVLHLLRRYLGEYVHGLSPEALRISVWKGDVVLKDLKLKADAFNSLKLPVTVNAGFVGTITLKVPWKSLGKEPVIVLIDRVFILAHPAPDGRTLQEEDRNKLFQAKLQHIEEAESATLEAISKSKLGNPPAGNTWLGSLIATIIGNLKISISNVHIRYEDSVSNPGHPFSAGVTLAKLAAVTMDEQGNETFDTSGALDKLRKSLQLERLAVYHDSNSIPWKIEKKWENLSPKEWVEIFEDGINEPSVDHGNDSIWAINHSYLVSPINGVLKYHRLGNQEKRDPEVPFEKASLILSDVSLTISEAQYYDWIKLLEVVSRYKIYVEVSHLRPTVPVSQGPFLWWRYAAYASLQQKKMCYRISWDQIQHFCRLRRHYVQLYAGLLQQLSNVNVSEIREIEKDLDSKVILLWRLLAHAKVETVKSKEAAEQRKYGKKSWFSLSWNSPSEVVSVGGVSEGSPWTEERLTKEEWQALNNLLRYQPDEELNLHSGNDMPNMIQFLVTVSIGQAAARIVSIHQTELVCGRFEQLHVSTKFRQRSIQCDVLLKFYGFSSPEGSLAQSVSSEQKENALAANFVHSPIGENIDWRLSATISPCHVTVLMETYARFLEFIKRSNAVSPAIALETATALQMKIEKVTRKAQEQFQMVLEEQSRFALDIDFDAPKVRVPIRTCASSKCDSHFLLDFGHFTLHTKESHMDEHGKNLYSHFYISGKDIAAFFTKCGHDCHNCTLDGTAYSSQSAESTALKTADNFYPLIDRCRMAVIVDQIKVQHPSYPSTLISVQVPSLGLHFSPARYFRLMELLNILYGTEESDDQLSTNNFNAELAPWNPAELSTNARILVWKGIGYSLAAWQPCFLVLSGLYLYVFDSEKSQSYQRCLSMAGKQVHEVPPANVGGSLFCIAVCFRGKNIQKALESSSTWVIELRDEDEKAAWMKELIQATYQASAPASVNVLGDSGDDDAECGETQVTQKKADLVINGALVETKLLIYGKNIETRGKVSGKPEETLILEVLAGGGKVHVVQSEGDLAVKVKLHSLKIKDELLGPLSMNRQYLACSVLTNDQIVSSPHISDLKCKELSTMLPEEDDIFKDALPDFLAFPDPAICSKFGDFNDYMGLESDDPFIHDGDIGKGKGPCGDIFYEAQGSDNSDFVSVTFLTKSPCSPDYDGIDTQMSIRMSRLEFFCNRPTLVALIDFGLDLSSVDSGFRNDSDVKNVDDDSLLDIVKMEDSGRSFVTGLLGYGKSRVVFRLNMNVDSVSVFLNKEDDTQLAMFVQESFLLDIKVHPSSLSVEGTLGNFRLCDMSLGMDHRWGWLCDIRNPGVESLIKFTFNSYSAADDDFEGYDYSLCGRLSAVRIVFLYRFIQEITVYFMELATPHTEEAIKLVDRVGDFEWLIQKYEIDGASALKLDLSLDTPIIIVPRKSTDNDFIQLDLGQLQIKNEFSWYGCPETDPSAVHIDTLHAKILGINMSVGVQGCIGKPMIREGQGLDVYVRRSLRDVFRKVPTFSLEVKVGLLHAVMSDKEYNVILDCALMNLNEEPTLPPSFRNSTSGSIDTMRLLVDKVNINSQVLLSRTVTIVTVEVNYALLELCNNIHEVSPLAHIILDGVWVSYRMTSLSETDLYITIPKFSILDIRPDTKAEMRLMLGSSTDASKPVHTGSFPLSSNKGSFMRMNSVTTPFVDGSNSTMFLMDYRWRTTSESFVVRVQQPRVLVVPDFLLAVAEFFVPALGAITGREETMDPKNDPICRNNRIVLSEATYRQNEDVVHLSSNRQLVADVAGVDEYTYDGCGGTICLNIESDSKENRSLRYYPIIIIGRGKRLRFMNVKIENGSLLRKYTYMSNGSSFSVDIEDNVDILLIENAHSNNDMKILDHMHDSFETSITSPYSQNESTTMQSFSFEAQVVSPEFTFYDGTKSCLDDSQNGEKLLRAKMDLSFMFASKENDTWVRALVKDLMIESGSGLVILDSVDLSGGYTKVKEKTNISLISTDVCIHLSLSAISLILNLQSQAATALQFGNSSPLALCTNFEKIWVSPKDNGPGNYLTFWRPRAPSNYVILGDCVTFRPIPPSQAVIAVSNSYGRVRKPLGFKLIGSFSGIQVLDQAGGDSDNECSLWLPVAPTGYTAMGCVAHIGSQPPPNHIVYCIRSDLITSTTYLECMLSAPSNLCFPTGFSIWRLDSVIGSFYAQASTTCPPSYSCCDLNHVLLWNSNRHQLSPEESACDLTDKKDFRGQQQENNQISNSSGWDILRSISKETNCYMSTPHFERIWCDKGGELRRPVSIWRPVRRPGYAILGDCITEGLEPPALGIIFKVDNPEVSAKPVQFTKAAHIVVKGLEEVFFWYPIAPPGYASLGCIVSKTDEAPRADHFCCPRIDLVNQVSIPEVPISKSSSTKASQCWCIWKIENQAHTFLARSDLTKPSNKLAYSIGDTVKPKTQENITADMKLRCFSLTVLDSSCGTMTPIFDTTITNIKLATHGQPEAMNAVLISSMAASTFNPQLEAWEPLVEPFDGIFKFETYDTNAGTPSKLGKRLRVSATSILNINISAASLETFAETMISWRRQIELDEKAKRINEEVNNRRRQEEDPTFSALDEDDFQTVILENKLGCDIYLKKVEQNTDVVELLHHDDDASVWIPPPRFSDRLNVANESGESRSYVAVHIYEAKGLPIVDDGNSHKFYCALRLVVDSQASDQQKLFPQSARTKCVRPFISKTNDVDEGKAKWNELFIFEVPRKGLAKLELEVTNLAAKAGKGEIIGAFSFSVGQGASLKKVASARMLHQSYDMQNAVSHPLRKRGQPNNDNQGWLLVSSTYCESKRNANSQNDVEKDKGNDRGDIGFWLGLNQDGLWESFRSLLPLSVVPKTLNDNFVAMEVVMKSGKRHAIVRGLASLVNELDIELEYAICDAYINSLDTKSCNVVVEEIFENQRCEPVTGRSNKWPGFHSNDPGQWSTKDLSYSSKEFFEPPLPPGWRWASSWTIDRSQFVDADGWAYGPEYVNLKWPLTSSKTCTKTAPDAVRRRRWVRTRQQDGEKGNNLLKSVFTTISPGSSAVLPWKSTCSNSEQCLLVRPLVDHRQPPYSWGHQAMAVGSGDAYGKEQQPGDQGGFSRQNTLKHGSKVSNYSFKLNQLEKKDVLLYCSSSAAVNKQFWLSAGADATVLHTELNAPVYDWKISVNSPLKLENRLPCPAEFTIWEKTKDGSSIEKQHGVISSRKSVHIYSADVQKPLYLSLFVQGGWVLDKDPVLVLDILSNEHVSSFWMTHQQSKRKLRVSMEREMGGTIASPKTIRFFVSYSIVNDSLVKLNYRLVEIESSETADIDSLSLSRTSKSFKTTLRSPVNSMERRHHGTGKNIQVLEVIEDTTPISSMFSPRDYSSRTGTFSSRSDASLSPRLAIAVAIDRSENFSTGISLFELENKERVDVKAFGSDGLYYKLSAVLNMTSDRTKVIHFLPHTLFINRVGSSVCMQQCNSQSVEWIHPFDPPKPFGWQSSAKVELLKLRLEGYKWSTPFSISVEGLACISLKKDIGSEQLHLRVEVRSGTKSSRYEVIFRPTSFSSPYRIENRSMFLPLCFRQVDGSSDSWKSMLPNSAASFVWEDLGRRRLLELMVDGSDPAKSAKYNIDETFDHQPISVAAANSRALRVTIMKEDKVNVIRISDWMPENVPSEAMPRSLSTSLIPLVRKDSQNQLSLSTLNCEFHVNVELAELGLSIVDHTPEEILYMSVQNLLFSHSSGLESGISSYNLRMHAIQIDNQLPLSPMPVLFRPQRIGEESDHLLNISMTLQSNGSPDLCVYPYIGFHGPKNSAFFVNVHEPIIWRLHEMIQQVNFSRLYDNHTTAVSVDPVIQIGVLDISEVRLKVSMTMSPTQRPRGVLGFWSSLMTALGNTENMPIRINPRYHENVCMRQSAMISNAISNIRKDLLSQPLQLLSGLDILGNASSALGHMSKGVAALSMDKKFIQSRQRKENKGIEDLGDVIREGGGAFAKGLFRGVTGILTKPLEGAKSSGVEGFVQGVGKGIIGAAAQPVSGVLDLLSKTTEGANAVRMKIVSAITSEEQLLRRRWPRVIGGDNLLRPYDDSKAQGQVILQLAESGSFFGQVDLFKIRGKFALSDAYEDHFLLPKGRILVVTHRRVILLQQPSNIIGQRKFSPARDPCSVLWDVLWDSLMTMELTHGKKDQQKAHESRLILYLQSTRSTDLKDQVRILKCSPESHQARDIFASIELAMKTYGPNKSKDTLKKKVPKPYSPLTDNIGAEVILKDGICIWGGGPQQVPTSVPLRSTFGSNTY